MSSGPTIGDARIGSISLNAVDFTPVQRPSAIPTDVYLVGCDNDSAGDEFDTADQARSFDRENPDPISMQTSPPDTQVKDPYTPTEDNLDAPRGNIDTGAMVSCTNDKTVIHGYKEYTPLNPSPIRLKAALEHHESVTPEGYGHLRCPTPNA